MFSKEEGTEQCLASTLRNLVKNFEKCQGPYQSSLKELVKSNIQDITVIKCATTDKKIGKSGVL